MSLRASTESNGPRDRSIATCVQKLYVYDVLDKYLFEDLKSWRDATGGINAQILKVGLFSVETHTPEGLLRKFCGTCTIEESLKSADIDQEG